MTAATLSPPVAATGNTSTTTRDPEILPRRTPSVRSNTLEPSNDTSLQRHSSTRSQTSALEKRKQQNQDNTSASRRPSERRKVIRIGNYVINRKTIGAGSMGKVKLATCLTDSDRQQVHLFISNYAVSNQLIHIYISTVCRQSDAQDQSSSFS